MGLTVQFWATLIIANVWQVTKPEAWQGTFWLVLAVMTLVADILIKYYERR